MLLGMSLIHELLRMGTSISMARLCRLLRCMATTQLSSSACRPCGPAIHAAFKGEEINVILPQCGAAVNARTGLWHQTALQFAKKRNHENIVAILLAHGAEDAL